MEKQYLAGFGRENRERLFSECRGYFECLEDDQTLKYKTTITPSGIEGEVYVENNWKSFNRFSEVFGKDSALWRMLLNEGGPNSPIAGNLQVIRAEVGEIKDQSLLLVKLNKRFAPLRFEFYPSDREVQPEHLRVEDQSLMNKKTYTFP